MIAPVAILAPFVESLRAPFSGQTETVRSQVARGWQLVVSKDRFTGAERCLIRSGGVVYQRGFLTFSFGHHVDTANALFRVDGAAARSVGEVAVEAAGRGAPFQSDNMANPSDGRVYIPLSQLPAAQRIDIRPNSRSRPRTFNLSGLDDALAVAKSKGCSAT